MTDQLTEPTVLVGGTADRPLSALAPSLPARTVGILERGGIATIAHLTEASDTELLDIRGIGPAALAAIRAVLASQQGSDHVWLEDLRDKLQAKTLTALARAGFLTADEVASVGNGILLDVPTVGPLTVQLIREATFAALAARHTAGRVMHLPGDRARESIALLAEIAVSALDRGDVVVHQLARQLLNILAPGIPLPGPAARPRSWPAEAPAQLRLVHAGPPSAPP
jgi:hypothetical protein